MLFIPPMLAQLVPEPFDSGEFVFERKLDGVRLIAVKEKNKVVLWTRNRKDRTKQFPEIAVVLRKWPGNFVLDGEAVVYDKKGGSVFQLIQPRVQQEDAEEIKKLARANPAVYEVFDLLTINGKSLLARPLLERKKLLKILLQRNQVVRFLPHREKEGKALFQKAKKLGWEGIVAKKKTSRYLPGKRGYGWLKIKAVLEQELVIGGFTRGYGKVAGSFGALLVGYYRGDDLIFAGEVGTGYTDEERRSLRAKLSRFKIASSPFQNPPTLKEITWVRPVLVGQFKFVEWTKDGLLRMPVYLGLRTDKKARKVVKEI